LTEDILEEWNKERFARPEVLSALDGAFGQSKDLQFQHPSRQKPSAGLLTSRSVGIGRFKTVPMVLLSP